MPYGLAHRPVWWGYFLNWGSLFQNLSSLYQNGWKLACEVYKQQRQNRDNLKSSGKVITNTITLSPRDNIFLPDRWSANPSSARRRNWRGNACHSCGNLGTGNELLLVGLEKNCCSRCQEKSLTVLAGMKIVWRNPLGPSHWLSDYWSDRCQDIGIFLGVS